MACHAPYTLNLSSEPLLRHVAGEQPEFAARFLRDWSILGYIADTKKGYMGIRYRHRIRFRGVLPPNNGEAHGKEHGKWIEPGVVVY